MPEFLSPLSLPKKSLPEDLAQVLTERGQEAVIKYPDELLNSDQEFFYWNRFPLGVQSQIPRVHLNGRVDLMFMSRRIVDSLTGEMLEDNEKEAAARNSNAVPLLDLGVDSTSVDKPAGELNFGHEYLKYRDRTYPAGSEYGEMVDRLADKVIDRIRQLDKVPDQFIAIPSRKEDKTSIAFNAIQSDHLKHGLLPFIVVLHNDTEKPLRGGGVRGSR